MWFLTLWHIVSIKTRVKVAVNMVLSYATSFNFYSQQCHIVSYSWIKLNHSMGLSKVRDDLDKEFKMVTVNLELTCYEAALPPLCASGRWEQDLHAPHSETLLSPLPVRSDSLACGWTLASLLTQTQQVINWPSLSHHTTCSWVKTHRTPQVQLDHCPARLPCWIPHTRTCLRHSSGCERLSACHPASMKTKVRSWHLLTEAVFCFTAMITLHMPAQRTSSFSSLILIIQFKKCTKISSARIY